MPGTVTLTPVIAGAVTLNLGSESSGYLLQESGFKIALENSSGFIILETGAGLATLTLVPVVAGTRTLTGTTAGSLTLATKTVGSLTLGSP